MNKFNRYSLATALALTSLAWGASPSYRSIATEQSSVSFTFRQMGVPMSGHFGRFTSTLDLHANRPDQAKGTIEIDLASIDTGSNEADKEVVGKSWFDVAAHPTARFVLGSLKPASGPRAFEAIGQLTLKGQSREIRVPLKLSPQGELTGGFVLKRADFRIGEGMWAKFNVIANDINVDFKFQLK